MEGEIQVSQGGWGVLPKQMMVKLIHVVTCCCHRDWEHKGLFLAHTKSVDVTCSSMRSDVSACVSDKRTLLFPDAIVCIQTI